MWRGRKLTVVNRPGLRPTGDRVRETLFNWLTPVIADADALTSLCGIRGSGLEALFAALPPVTLLMPMSKRCYPSGITFRTERKSCA